jgi:hypothetical protein
MNNKAQHGRHTINFLKHVLGLEDLRGVRSMALNARFDEVTTLTVELLTGTEKAVAETQELERLEPETKRYLVTITEVKEEKTE